MKSPALVLLLAAGLLAGSAAQAQTTARVRATITAVDANTLSVRTREGEDLQLPLNDKLSVGVATAVRFEDIKPGDLVGATTRKRADGTWEAIEVHYLPPTAAQGQSAWDLAPETTMTNASVAAAVAATGTRELMLEFKGGSQRIVVPESTPLVRAVPGTRADLKPGEYVFAVVQKAADGTLSLARVQVSRGGVRPPQ